MYKKAFFGIFFMIAMSTGCSNIRNDNIEEVNSYSQEITETKIDLYQEKEIELGKYEPVEGVYIGAYAEKNKILGDSIIEFEKSVEKEQAFRVFQYAKPGDISPLNILECIANQQTPYIKILWTQDFSMNTMYRLIGDIGRTYNVPIFIELFPVTENITDPTRYKQYYEEAYDMLTKYIENSVIVWSIDLDRTYELTSYYPGDEWVDWVGLNVYLPQYRNGEAYAIDFMESIDFWYTHFQETKPMMFSSLAISHFSRYDYTYKIQDAKNKITVFYDELLEMYPRIKGILYIDVNMNEINSSGKEDYRLTSESEILKHYSSLLDSSKFLGHLVEEEEIEQSLMMKYTVPIIEIGEEQYIQDIYVNHLFNTIKINKISSLKNEEGNVYYKLEDLIKQINAYYIKNY